MQGIQNTHRVGGCQLQRKKSDLSYKLWMKLLIEEICAKQQSMPTFQDIWEGECFGGITHCVIPPESVILHREILFSVWHAKHQNKFTQFTHYPHPSQNFTPLLGKVRGRYLLCWPSLYSQTRLKSIVFSLERL